MPAVKQLRQHKLLLDTHVWLWSALENGGLSNRFLKALDRIAEKQEVLVSAMSVWEIGMLDQKRRIDLGMDVLDWVENALRAPHLTLAPISPRVAVQSNRLPNLDHGDPVDRLLVATAREHNAVLVTCDAKLLKFGQSRFITVHDPR
jgi:PIN domain nuclease of toxin-antitoxin system